MDSDGTFNPEVSNKKRKTNGRFGGGNKKDEEGERQPKERIKGKTREDEKKVYSKK